MPQTPKPSEEEKRKLREARKQFEKKQDELKQKAKELGYKTPSKPGNSKPCQGI